MKTYEKYTNKPNSFLTINTTFSSDDSSKLNATFQMQSSIGTCMTLADKVKTLDDKVKANQDQYSLAREVAKMSALSLAKLDKQKV